MRRRGRVVVGAFVVADRRRLRVCADHAVGRDPGHLRADRDPGRARSVRLSTRRGLAVAGRDRRRRSVAARRPARRRRGVGADARRPGNRCRDRGHQRARRDIDAIAVGLYIQPGSSNADDLAVVTVVRLRPDVFDDGWFRVWRDTLRRRRLQQVAAVSHPAAAETRIGAARRPPSGRASVGSVIYHVHLRRTGSPHLDHGARARAASVERLLAGLTE